MTPSLQVKNLQSFLKSLNYFTLPYSTDYFGPLTKQALQDFQKDNEIRPASGVFGNITASYIDNNCAKLKSREYFENLRIKQERENKEKLKKEKKKEEKKKEANTKNQTKKETQNKPQSNKTTQNTSSSIKNTVKRIFSIFTAPNKENSYAQLTIKPVPVKKVSQVLKEPLANTDKITIAKKDGSTQTLQIEMPKYISKTKKLDVPLAAQYLSFLPYSQRPPEGYNMCSGASAVMIAAYYKKLNYDKTKDNISSTLNGKSYTTNQSLREYIYQDKGQELNASCKTTDGSTVTGAFAVTSEGRCDMGYLSGVKRYFSILNLKHKNLKSATFSKVREIIDKNHPVYFGEPMHLMVATGYAELPGFEKTPVEAYEEVLGYKPDGSRYVKEVKKIEAARKSFILIVNDPWRNRNRKPQNNAFFMDGKGVGYLIVERKVGKNKEEYMCRYSYGQYKGSYLCTSIGNVALEVFE